MIARQTSSSLVAAASSFDPGAPRISSAARTGNNAWAASGVVACAAISSGRREGVATPESTRATRPSQKSRSRKPRP